jgi:Na+-translocating ferredoxin:NAD+ oxidoreductase RnfA subunit
VDIKPATGAPRTVALLLVAGLACSVLGMTLIGVSVDHDHMLGAVGAAAASVVGFALVLTGLVTWALRTRRTAARPVDTTPAPAVA